jgi:hypothetical protein
MNNSRYIYVRLQSKEDLEKLSDKVFPENSDLKLSQKTKSVRFNGESIDIKTKKTMKRLPTPELEYNKHWKDLTPFSAPDIEPYAQIEFYFEESYTNEKLSEFFGQTFSDKTKSIFYPIKEPEGVNLLRTIGDRGNPQYPIYIISKGRADNSITADHLIKMGVEDFRIVIEEQEWDDYAKHYGADRLLALDMTFKDEYDTYIDNFDESKSKGSGPARNFVWWHAKNVIKSKWHWIMDDNIYGFFYYNDRKRVKAVDGSLFSAAEDFVNRYDNIGVSGLNYYMFAIPKDKNRPYVPNSKIYSCLLINNDINIRWAGRYNEDVDLCIRALKEGYSTIQFDAFLSRKGPTQSLGGGNTDAFYAEEGTLPKSNQLAWNHPDITNVSWRFSRWHHVTNYGNFVYCKDRTIEDTITSLSQAQILNPVYEEDKLILDEIRKIDYTKINEWDNILDSLQQSKKEIILNVLKKYRYTKDLERAINVLTKPRILNCELDSYKWQTEMEDTLDNRIMLDLFKLSDSEGKLFKAVNWEEYLDYVPEVKRNIIVDEMQRNKYLLKDYEKFNYNIRTFKITEEEHETHNDSKEYLTNKYFDGNFPNPPVTFYDQRMRGEVKIEKNSFVSNLHKRDTIYKKQVEKNVTMFHTEESFMNNKLLINTLNENYYDEVISSVFFESDLIVANYCLKNKIPNCNFVPDIVKHGKGAYKKMYDDMSNYADSLILVIEKELSNELIYLKEAFESKNKVVKIIKENKQNIIEEW